MNVNREALFVPRPQEILVVRGTKDNRTVEWAVNVSSFEMIGPHLIRMEGKLIAAEFNDGTDSRLKNQRASIDQMQQHLNHHHAGLAGIFPCEWQRSLNV